MGTNFYAFRKDPSEPNANLRELPEAMSHPDGMHIGKSSAGWCFSLHVHPDEGVHSLDDWRALITRHDVQVKDEYSTEVSAEEMMENITKRSFRDGVPFNQAFKPGQDSFFRYKSLAEFHQRNNSEEGPNGLLRHKVGRTCVGNGEGTWDLLVGDFS